MGKEIWKSVVGYESLYEVSNIGNVRSLDRVVNHSRYGSRRLKGKDMVIYHSESGYCKVTLYKNGKQKLKAVHQLVAESFLNHKPCGHVLVVNHIDFNKSNNHVSNLEIITQRENANKKHIPSSSKYIGVSWNKYYSMWFAQIKVNGKSKILGFFLDEYEAHLCYEKALSEVLKKEIENGYKKHQEKA